MSNANLGWLFYKDYYKYKDKDEYKDIDYLNMDSPQNEIIIKEKVENIINQSITIEASEPLGNIHFKATTTYPGLLLGSGYNHQLSIKEELILGFDFDYTSGLPIIRGSSIKGVLKSAFKHWEYVSEISDLKSEVKVKELEKEIFDNGDIFFDATIISGGKILEDDYLAPHKNSKKIKDKNNNLIADELCNPTPLRFIKVAPNVTFRFDFLLSDGIISEGKKRKLFENILEDLGVGAKTNVGYGKFENFSIIKTEEEKQEDKLKLKKEKIDREKQRLEDIEEQKKIKAIKASDGINQLLSCKDMKEGMKILNSSFGKKPELTNDEKDIVKLFLKGHSLTNSQKKFFGKYNLDI